MQRCKTPTHKEAQKPVHVTHHFLSFFYHETILVPPRPLPCFSHRALHCFSHRSLYCNTSKSKQMASHKRKRMDNDAEDAAPAPRSTQVVNLSTQVVNLKGRKPQKINTGEEYVGRDWSLGFVAFLCLCVYEKHPTAAGSFSGRAGTIRSRPSSAAARVPSVCSNTSTICCSRIALEQRFWPMWRVCVARYLL